MPSEHIPGIIPAGRDAVRQRIEYAKPWLGNDASTAQLIAWVSFLWGAMLGGMIGPEDLRELRELLPTLGYNPVEEMMGHPTSPENRALVEASEEDDPVWTTAAEHDHRDLTNGLYFYGGRMPEREAIAWYAYLQGQLEAEDLTEAEHADLVRLLPKIENNPLDLIIESAKAGKVATKA